MKRQPSDDCMSDKQEHLKYRFIFGITATVGVAVMLLFLSACGGKGKKLGEAIDENDSLPDMRTTGVTSLVSDSGMIRYKILTEEWLIYSKRNPPYWAFEKGLYLEKFDTLFRVDASIKADTAYYYERKKLWELRGNVHIQSQRGDRFDTELMFWDQDKEKIYSDRFVCGCGSLCWDFHAPGADWNLHFLFSGARLCHCFNSQPVCAENFYCHCI